METRSILWCTISNIWYIDTTCNKWKIIWYDFRDSISDYVLDIIDNTKYLINHMSKLLSKHIDVMITIGKDIFEHNNIIVNDKLMNLLPILLNIEINTIILIDKLHYNSKKSKPHNELSALSINILKGLTDNKDLIALNSSYLRFIDNYK